MIFRGRGYKSQLLSALRAWGQSRVSPKPSPP